jgi:hypothetical protein
LQNRLFHRENAEMRKSPMSASLHHRSGIGTGRSAWPPVTLLLLFFSFIPGCDTGLEPLNGPSGFSGVIRYVNWPPADSLRSLRLVAFETYPSDSAGILSALLSGLATVYPTIGGPDLPSYVAETPYDFTTNGTTLQVKEYAYVAVAVQYGPNILSDWRPVGVYTTQAGTFNPSPVRVLLHRIVPGIDINVDFHNLPPKPWR